TGRFSAAPVDIIRLDIAAGTECALAGAGEDRHAQRRVIVEFRPDVSQAFVCLEVAGVQPFGSIDGYVGNLTFLFEYHFHRWASPATRVCYRAAAHVGILPENSAIVR